MSRLRCLAIVCGLTCGISESHAAFIPDDPYFYTGTPAGFPGQWHLDRQTSGATIDANVRGAWNRGLTGNGVVIAIMEPGAELNHPDLAANARPDLSWDFGTNSSNFTPANHWTSVAGVAAARGGNGLGTTGAAPHASVAAINHTTPLNLRSEAEAFDIQAAAAFRHRTDEIDIKSMSWGWIWPYDNLPQSEAAVRDTVAQGEIVVAAAMNYRGNTEFRYADVNSRWLTHLPETIVVAAAGSDGKFADYSNYGSNVTVTAPSLSAGLLAITTTDVVGEGGYNNSTGDAHLHRSLGEDLLSDLDYTTTFSGTSSATPLVSGILALAKEAQPNLDTRFAKHLLARTSRLIDPDDATVTGGWMTNAAGIHFNNNYGFGLIDADALTLAATEFQGVTALEKFGTGRIEVDSGAIREETHYSKTFSVPAGQPLEEVEIRLGLISGAANISDIEGIITSPSGVSSVFLSPTGYDRSLRDYNNDSLRYIDWTFSSNAFWGEDPEGEWTVTLYDRYFPGVLTEFGQIEWDFMEATLRRGSLLAVPEPGGFYLALVALLIGIIRIKTPTRCICDGAKGDASLTVSITPGAGGLGVATLVVRRLKPPLDKGVSFAHELAGRQEILRRKILRLLPLRILIATKGPREFDGVIEPPVVVSVLEDGDLHREETLREHGPLAFSVSCHRCGPPNRDASQNLKKNPCCDAPHGFAATHTTSRRKPSRRAEAYHFPGGYSNAAAAGRRSFEHPSHALKIPGGPGAGPRSRSCFRDHFAGDIGPCHVVGRLSRKLESLEQQLTRHPEKQETRVVS